MATKKPNKLPNKKNIGIAVKYCVELPDKVLKEVISLGCAKRLDEFGKAFSESMNKLKKAGSISKDVFYQFSDTIKALAATTVVLDIIEDTWMENVKGECDDKCKKLKCKKEKKPAVKAEKKQKTGGILSKAEKIAIKQLRNKGLSIKAIGKAIKRGEKVVANYIHELEKTPKRK